MNTIYNKANGIIEFYEEVNSDEEEEQEQLYCDYCCNQTNCISATEEGWVGDIETGEWKCVSCKNEKKSCKHIYECGCDKDYCDSCKEEMGEEEDESNLDWCEDESCKHYYKYRNDNCNCAGMDCGFCK